MVVPTVDKSRDTDVRDMEPGLIPLHQQSFCSIAMREPLLRKTWEYSNITKPLISYERSWPLACLDGLIKPNQASHPGCQVNIKCFYAKSTCLGSNYRNISSLTLVQKVIPGYLFNGILWGWSVADLQI
jgi:hypothetical protein